VVTARRPEGDDPHPNVTVVGTPAPVTVASGERASIDAACDAAGDATVELVVVAWTTDDDDDRVTTASTTVNASCAA
jgi:hypothetical protein